MRALPPYPAAPEARGKTSPSVKFSNAHQCYAQVKQINRIQLQLLLQYRETVLQTLSLFNWGDLINSQLNSPSASRQHPFPCSCPFFPLAPCATSRTPGGDWAATDLQDRGGESTAEAAASSGGLGRPASCGTPGSRLPCLGYNKETAGLPYIALVPGSGRPRSCNELSVVSLFHYISPPFSMASQKWKSSNAQTTITVGKTLVCNFSKYNSVVPIKLKTEKWHKKNAHYLKLQFLYVPFYCLTL